MFELCAGIPMEDLIVMLEESGWDYTWEMDQLYVSDVEDHWIAVEFVNGAVERWETV